MKSIACRAKAVISRSAGDFAAGILSPFLGPRVCVLEDEAEGAGDSLERQRIRDDLTAAYYNVKEYYRNNAAKHLLVAADGRTRCNSYKFREKFLIRVVLLHWNRVSRESAQPASFAVFKTQIKNTHMTCFSTGKSLAIRLDWTASRPGARNRSDWMTSRDPFQPTCLSSIFIGKPLGDLSVFSPQK